MINRINWGLIKKDKNKTIMKNLNLDNLFNI